MASADVLMARHLHTMKQTLRCSRDCFQHERHDTIFYCNRQCIRIFHGRCHDTRVFLFHTPPRPTFSAHSLPATPQCAPAANDWEQPACCPAPPPSSATCCFLSSWNGDGPPNSNGCTRVVRAVSCSVRRHMQCTHENNAYKSKLTLATTSMCTWLYQNSSPVLLSVNCIHARAFHT